MTRQPSNPAFPPDLSGILPPPFDWCEIPANPAFRLITDRGDLGIFPIQPFYMAKYLITYAQYQQFLVPGGFDHDQWWKGLDADAARRQQPGEQEWKIDNHPRERICWWDAVAFTRWLSAKTGTDIRLPTEWEWQWAAQGTDGRKYAWGDDFDQNRCNTSESRLNQTTPVDRYPNGASPYGVFDMSGNVEEWCLNEAESPREIVRYSTNLAVARGGSWDENSYAARTEYREGYYLFRRLDKLGFRLACFFP